jgi:hypothetical protein
LALGLRTKKGFEQVESAGFAPLNPSTMRASLSPLLSSLANAFRIPIQQMSRTPLSCNSITQTHNGTLTKTSILSSVRPFSSTSSLAAGAGKRNKVDRRISAFETESLPLSLYLTDKDKLANI